MEKEAPWPLFTRLLVSLEVHWHGHAHALYAKSSSLLKYYFDCVFSVIRFYVFVAAMFIHLHRIAERHWNWPKNEATLQWWPSWSNEKSNFTARSEAFLFRFLVKISSILFVFLS